MHDHSTKYFEHITHMCVGNFINIENKVELFSISLVINICKLIMFFFFNITSSNQFLISKRSAYHYMYTYQHAKMKLYLDHNEKKEFYLLDICMYNTFYSVQ